MAYGQKNKKLTGDIGSGWTSPELYVGKCSSGSIELIVAAGATGNFFIEVSNSGTNFYTVDDSTLAADDAGLFWNLGNINFRFVRVGYDGSSVRAFELHSLMKEEETHKVDQKV